LFEIAVSVLLTMMTAAPRAVSSIIDISAMMSAVPSSFLMRARWRVLFIIAPGSDCGV
jgi:hypothetical protein